MNSKIFITIKILAFTIICFTYPGIVAQKHDYVWLLGQENFDKSNICQDGMALIFHGNVQIQNKSIKQVMRHHNTSFSDSQGKLLYYSNGCSIRDNKGNIINGGDSLNLLFDYGEYCAGLEQDPNLLQTVGYPFPNSALFLPLADSTIIYLSLETWLILKQFPYVFSPNVLVTLIDTFNNRIIYKNKPVFSDSFHMVRYGLVATRHPNELTWWAISRNFYNSTFNIIKISPDSISYSIQSIGNNFSNSDVGQAVLSPNGDRLAWYTKQSGVEIMKFDKAKGVLFDYKKAAIIDTAQGNGGIAFSASGRFLYVSTVYDLFQFDLDDPNFEHNSIQIAHIENVICGCTNNKLAAFQKMQLGPDCRIYISAVGSSRCLHYIAYPDNKGHNCKFNHAGIILPYLNYNSLPYFPNYRSNQEYPCDSTIGFITNSFDFEENNILLNIYPNPSYDQLNVDIEWQGQGDLEFILTDINGRDLLEYKMYAYPTSYTFNISHLQPALYFYTIRSSQQVLRNGKIIKLE